ncbi:MAG: carboxypeptidase regulatory-like domain-containing protein [Candidatus Binatia bacterium]
MFGQIVLISVFLLFSSSASAEIYKWVDENGHLHFTDGSSPMPTKYKSSNDSREPQVNSSSQNSSITLTGSIIDPRKILLQGVTDEGAPWSGKLDRVGRQVVDITAYSGTDKLVSVHPDENGEFAITAEAAVSHVTLAVSGGGLYIRKDGPWRSDATVDLDLANGVFIVDGYVRNVDGTPVQREMVSAYDETREKCIFAYTNSTGYFKVWSNRKIASLETSADRLRIVKNGPWSRSATLTLAHDKSKLFTIKGRVIDKTGMPTAGVRISALLEGNGGKSTMSDANGYYEISTDKKIKLMYGYYDLTHEEIKKPGSWAHDATVDFVFNLGDVFTLKGQVTDQNGQPLKDVFVYASDASGSRVQTTRTDYNGDYTLVVAKTVESLTAYRFPTTPRADIAGPWTSDANIDIRLQ